MKNNDDILGSNNGIHSAVPAPKDYNKKIIG